MKSNSRVFDFNNYKLRQLTRQCTCLIIRVFRFVACTSFDVKCHVAVVGGGF